MKKYYYIYIMKQDKENNKIFKFSVLDISKEAYEEFQKKKKYNLTKDEYMKLILDFNSFVCDYILDGNMVSLPFRIGSLQLVCRKPKRKPIDWVATRKQGKTVYFDNTATEGNVAKFIFYPGVRFKNIARPGSVIASSRSFMPSFTFAKRLASEFRNNYTKFMNFGDGVKLDTIKKITRTYNEFDYD